MDQFDMARGSEPGALAVLCSVLSKVFSYPSVEQARDLAEMESMEYCSMLVGLSGADASLLGEAERGFVAACPGSRQGRQAVSAQATFEGGEEDARDRGRGIRLEMSRLFYSPLTGTAMEGSRWVNRDERSTEALEVGERAAVARFYSAWGYRVSPGVPAAADSLENELEFVSRLAARESEALSRGDAAEALRLRDARREFHRLHLSGLGYGVSGRIVDSSKNPHLRYYAAVLKLALQRVGE